MKRHLVVALCLSVLLLPCTGLARQESGSDGDLHREVRDLKQRVRALERLVHQLQEALQKTAHPEAATSPPASTSTPASAATASPPSAPLSSASQPARPALHAYWNEGLRLDSTDRAFQFRMGGRIQNDWAFRSAEEGLEQRVGSLTNTVEFRRARLYVAGTVYKRVVFKAQYDFASGHPAFDDLYVGVKRVPLLGTVRVGHLKEPFGLDGLTSSKYSTFMERGLTGAFLLSRNSGILLHNTLPSKRMTFSAGVFRDTGSVGSASGGGNFNYTFRVTGLPLDRDRGRHLFHLGLSFSHRNPPDNLLRFSQRPETHTGPRYVDTGTFPARSENRFGIESALVEGPLSVQGEYYRSASTGTPLHPDHEFSGFYLQGSFFLTGEHRPYSGSSGAFTRLRPRHSFGSDEGGTGAWEIAARYSRLTLNDGDILGGKLQDFSLGLNWYLNPNSRVMCDYVFSDLNRVGSSNILQTRFQIDF